MTNLTVPQLHTDAETGSQYLKNPAMKAMASKWNQNLQGLAPSVAGMPSGSTESLAQ